MTLGTTPRAVSRPLQLVVDARRWAASQQSLGSYLGGEPRSLREPRGVSRHEVEACGDPGSEAETEAETKGPDGREELPEEPGTAGGGLQPVGSDERELRPQ